MQDPASPSVLNQRIHGRPSGSVYIGRPSKWGNPYVIGRDGTREQVIAKYEQWLVDSGLINDIGELAGKDLVCWCAPEPCHGDVLLRYASSIALISTKQGQDHPANA